jgi:hypothetical protein
VGVVIAVVVAVALVAAYLTWTAERLDRLHARTDGARAALDAQLLRRGAAAIELAGAARGRLPDGALDELAAAAYAVRLEDADREAAESRLSRALRQSCADPDLLEKATGEPHVGALLGELDALTTKVVYARSFHNSAVRDTLAVRRRRLVRWLGLAGRAALPAYVEFDDTPPPELRNCGANRRS